MRHNMSSEKNGCPKLYPCGTALMLETLRTRRCAQKDDSALAIHASLKNASRIKLLE